MDIRPFQPADEAAVIALWQQCGLVRPWNDPHKDIQRKLAVRPDLFLVGELEGRVAACVMAGYERASRLAELPGGGTGASAAGTGAGHCVGGRTFIKGGGLSQN